MKQISVCQYRNQVKIASAVRKIDTIGVLHDSVDIDFEGVLVILQRYGIFENWTDAELGILKRYLLGISFNEEMREAVLWGEMQY